MKSNRARIGLSILAGSLSFVGTSSALDLVIDGSYETSTNNMVNAVVGLGVDSGGAPDMGWTAFTTYTYAAGYTQPGPTGSGQVYLRPYDSLGGSRTVSQTVSLTRAVTEAQIDSTTGQFTASAWFSTYFGQNDYSTLTLEFLDLNMQPIGSTSTLGGAAFVAAIPGGSDARAWANDTKTGGIPVGARYAKITTVGTALSGSPDGYVDLVSLDVTSGFVPVSLASSPLNGATGVSPTRLIQATLTDGTAPLNPASLLLVVDGAAVTPSVSKTDNVTTLAYAPGGLWAPLSPHSYYIAYGNTGGATPNTTNQFAFTIAPYVDAKLGPPLYLETFDTVAETELPAGWSVESYTDSDLPWLDINDFRSDYYTNWVVISRSTLSNLTAVVPDGPDLLAAFNVAPNQVVNGAVITNLIETNFIFAVADRGTGNAGQPDGTQKQIQYLFTRDFNLTGKTNIYLAFHNIYVQNQDSMGAVEYSINGGTTWLPALYMLEPGDVLTDSSGSINASNTFAARHSDIPDLDAGTLTDGFYGRYIAVHSNQWASLAPFISPRTDNDATASKRVEIVRLPLADNQAAVRLRFAQVGVWSWYFGMDNVGLYSVAQTEPPLLVGSPTPAAQTVAIGNSATLTIPAAIGLGPIAYQWRHDGTNLPGQTAPALSFPIVTPQNAGTYDVVASNPGGSITSSVAVITVVNPPVFVTGQWDFNNSLTATYGQDLEFYDATVAADSTFGTTTSFGIPDINGTPATVLTFNPSVPQWGGLKMFHGASANGGGAYVNQYTLIYDLYFPSSSLEWLSLLQTATGNGNDGDIFLRKNGGLGISGNYPGVLTPDTWHRVAFAFDLSVPVLTKFIDGVKVGHQTAGLSGVDGRFSMDPAALLFADESGETTSIYVSSVQFSNGRRPDAFLAGLGGPSSAKIPGVIKVEKVSGSLRITWTGGVPLESATSLSGPWSTVPGASSPYTPATGGTAVFYRPKLF